MLRVAAFACLLVFLFGCGDSDPDDPSETSYGPLEDVKAYRQNIEPIIVEVSAIEALVQERAVGSANVATAENLYPIYLEQRPKLLQIMEHIDRIKPPSALADLHQDIRRLVTLRLEAYGAVIDGWEAQDETRYEVAEGKLRQANALIVSLNEKLMDVDRVVGEADGGNPVAA